MSHFPHSATLPDLNEILTPSSWVTADQHWEHPRIREYQRRPENHFEQMQIKWNSRVGHNDVVLHLGDLVCFGDRERHPFWLDGLHGQKYLIRGNHDQHSDAWYEAAGFQVLGRGNRPFYWTPGPHVIAFSHEPLIDPKWAGFDVNIHGHIHANELWHSLPGHWYENVSVEVVDYAPVQLSNVIGGI